MKLTEKVANIVASLEDKFGIPQRKTNLDPLSNLILTVLSQNPNDKNRDQAYHRLKESFPTWDQVMRANVKKIKAAIRPGGLAKQKSERIKNILKWIHQEYGSLNLDNLCTMNPEEAIEKFCQLKGIGVKTISVVLMFSCGIDINLLKLGRTICLARKPRCEQCPISSFCDYFQADQQPE